MFSDEKTNRLIHLIKQDIDSKIKKINDNDAFTDEQKTDMTTALNTEKEAIIQQIKKQNKNYSHDVNYSHAIWLLIFIGVVNLVIWLIFWPIGVKAETIIGLGIFDFIGILWLSNYLSGTNPFNTGEFRQAITILFVFTYISVMCVSLFSGKDSNIVSMITGNPGFIQNFSTLTGTILLFYFTSRTVEEVAGKK